ncbi:DedA family protein [Actinoplanes sp. NPDC051343]|uniref:DedA family protein n=1 Tax=Actinoplanes sp. NPDC051343 TaxID=3363906 RepID=UPI0037AD4E8E
MSILDVVALPLLGVVSRFGYLGVSGIVFIESFGVPAPGETSIIAGSVLAGSGRLNIFVVALVAFLAAVGGDSIGYLIGRTGGRSLLLRFGRYVGLNERRLARVEKFMARRGAAMVVVARFIEGLRQLNGVVAGVTRMPFLKFLICNAIGAALWVGVWSSAGYFAGNHLDAIEGAFHRYSNVALAAIVVLVAAYIWHHVRRRRAHRAEDLKAESDNPSPAR